MQSIARIRKRTDAERVVDLRRRVRAAMAQPPVGWNCPEHIDERSMDEPLAVRKARAVALKLVHMPDGLWEGQLFAGSMTLEEPRLHAEWGFPEYTTKAERAAAAEWGLTTHSVFGHIVPDYPRLLNRGLSSIREEARNERGRVKNEEERAFLDSVIIAVDGVVEYAARLAARCEEEAEETTGERRDELRTMAVNLRQVPAGAA